MSLFKLRLNMVESMSDVGGQGSRKAKERKNELFKFKFEAKYFINMSGVR